MLDEHNTHAKNFRMARDRLKHSEVHNIRLRLIAIREKDGPYHLWGDDSGSTERANHLAYIPAPKQKLPGIKCDLKLWSSKIYQ